jgi:hypothetical protein
MQLLSVEYDIANKSFGKVANFRYLGMTATKQIFIHEEIKSSLNSRKLMAIHFSLLSRRGKTE